MPSRLYAERIWVVDTKVSSKERTSAALVAGVVVFGFAVSVLFMIWLTLFSNQTHWNSSATYIGVADFSDAEEDNLNPEGFINDWLPPGLEEMELDEPQLMDALQAVTETVSTMGGQIEAVDGDANRMGGNSGLGDNRKPGLIQKVYILPEWERWKIEYSASSRTEYIKMLGNLKVTLGAVAQISNQIVFVDDLQSDKPSKTTGDRESELAKCLYFRVLGDRMRRWEKTFLKEQGVELENRLVVHFINAENRIKLLTLEREVFEAAGKVLEEVERTRFGVRAKGDGFEFYVIDDGIKYRPKPTTKSNRNPKQRNPKPRNPNPRKLSQVEIPYSCGNSCEGGNLLQTSQEAVDNSFFAGVTDSLAGKSHSVQLFCAFPEMAFGELFAHRNRPALPIGKPGTDPIRKSAKSETKLGPNPTQTSKVNILLITFCC